MHFLYINGVVRCVEERICLIGTPNAILFLHRQMFSASYFQVITHLAVMFETPRISFNSVPPLKSFLFLHLESDQLLHKITKNRSYLTGR